ncbi:MAG: MoxR-like ATPase in aerotolerance operon, partial [uncultured Solirubrobacteraceae bacterium]
ALLRLPPRPHAGRPPHGADRGALRGQAGHRRPGRDARAAARRAARRRPRPARGRAGPRQDADGQHAGPDARRDVQARAVHAGPGPVGPRRHPHLPPGHGPLRRRARPRVRQLPAGRRDQPRPGEGPVRAPGGHAGAPGDHRGDDLPAARAVPRARHAEPDRVRGHVPAARGAGRPLPHEDHRGLPDRGRGGRGGRPRDHAARPRPAARGGHGPRRLPRPGARGLRGPRGGRLRRLPGRRDAPPRALRHGGPARAHRLRRLAARADRDGAGRPGPRPPARPPARRPGRRAPPRAGRPAPPHRALLRRAGRGRHRPGHRRSRPRGRRRAPARVRPARFGGGRV